MFLALSINTEGQKELPGMWLAENEGAKFWLSVLTELKNRGLQDILNACVDGIEAQTSGETQKKGRKGEIIRVKNESSGQVVSAIVVEAGVVKTVTGSD